MLQFLSRPAREVNQASGFLAGLAHDAALALWVLVCQRGRASMEIASFRPGSDAAREWIAKRSSLPLYCVTGEVTGQPQGKIITEADIRRARIVAVSVPKPRLEQALAVTPRPSLIAETQSGYTLAWRLYNPLPPWQAAMIANSIAARTGGEALDFLFPVPGPAGVRLLRHLKGPENWTLVTQFDDAEPDDGATETAASEPLFAPAESFEIEATDWLWPDIIACGDLTLLGGAPGMGKSQMAIYAAATVSRGGTWPDGSQAQRGSVILCETEDRPGNALRPRLEAAGADISRIQFGRHMDLSTNMAALAAQAERLTDLRLLVLSPVLTFFGATSNDENTVRAKLRPMLEWAAARSVGVLGIIHPLKDGPADVFAGCDAYRRASRAAWRLTFDPTDDQPVEKIKRRVLFAAKVNNAPDALRLQYRIKGVELAGGIRTSRVVFPSPQHGEGMGEGQGEASAPPKGTEGARLWLEAFLLRGPRDSGEIKRAAAAAKIAESTLDRAAKQLGVIRQDQPGLQTKQWRLPG